MEKARTNFLVIVLCVCTSAAFAQNYSELNGPFGGQVYDILSTGTTLIASVPGQGIVRSTDGGSVWEESNTGINDFYIRDLEWDEVSGKIYALANQHLYSSSDDGLAWITEASSGFEGASFLKRTSSYFFIISQYSKTVYRSTNGTSWSVINSPVPLLVP